MESDAGCVRRHSGFPQEYRERSVCNDLLTERSLTDRGRGGIHPEKPVRYRELPWCRIMRSPEPFVRVPAMCCRRLCSSESKSSSV